MTKSLIIIPAYNEEKNISEVLTQIRKNCSDIDIIVINDGSTDHTEQVVLEKSEKVITLPFNMGYGGALQTGFKYAVKNGYQYVVQFDADGQHDPENIESILSELYKKEADIVIGSRFLGKSFKLPFSKKIAIHFFRYLIKSITGTMVSDPTSGLKGLTKRTFEYYAMMGNYPNDFPDADILIQSMKCNYKIVELPANIRTRVNGTSMHSGLKPIFYLIKMLLSISIILIRIKLSKEDCN